MEITFEHMADALIRAGITESPSELHGMFCGRLSGGQQMAENECLAAVSELFEAERSKVDMISAELMAVYDMAAEKLEETGFDFELLLPDDDFELTQRLDLLGQWCQGYLVGLGLSGLSSEATFSADAADALKDLAQIAQVDPQEMDSEEGEVSFFEVVEYVRMAALLIQSEVNIPKETTKPTLH